MSLAFLFILGFFIAVPFVLLVVALFDILKSDFKGTDKLVWVVVVVFVPYLGFVLYYLIGTNQKLGKKEA